MSIEEAREILGNKYSNIDDETLLKLITMLETISLILIENELSKK